MDREQTDSNVIVGATTPAPVALPPARYALRSRAVPAAVLGLMVGIFAIDCATPRGMVGGPLYAVPILVALFSPQWRRNSLLTALIASVFLPIGVLVSSDSFDVHWIVAYWNLSISLLVIWVAWYAGIRAKKAFVTIADSEEHLRISAKNLARSNVELEQSSYILRKSEDRFRIMADCVPALIWINGADKRSTYFNKPWLEFTGHTLEQEIDNGWIAGVHPDDRARYLEVFTKAFEVRATFALDYRLRRHDGDYRWITDQGVPRFDRRGGFLGYIGSAIDITERKQAEHRLADSERRLRTIFNNEPECVKLLGADCILLEMNPAGLRMIEADSLAQVVGQSILDRIRPEYRADFADLNERVLRGESGSLEFEIQGIKGTRRQLETHAVPIHDESGEPRALAITRDITERKYFENSLRERERELADFFEHATLGLHWVGPDGIILRVNQCELDLLGYTREGYLGHHIAEFHADQNVIDDILQCLMRGEELHEYAARLKCKDGSIRDVMISSNVLWENGRFVHSRCFTRDVTDRKKAEEQVRAAQHILETVLNNIPQGVFWKDRQSRYLGCNAVVARVFGMVPEQFIGKTDHDLPGLTQEQAAHFIQKDQEVVASGQPQLGIVEQSTHGSGRTVWLETSKLPMRDHQGEVCGILGTWQDITQRKSLEEQLRQSQKMEAFGQLAGGVAHDFNNLLTVVLGFSELLLLQLPSQDPMRSPLQAISEAGERGASLTQQLLAFSRQAVLETKVFNLNSVVGDTEKMLRRMIGEDVLLTTVLDPKLKSMKADPGQLGQVLMNLAVNSRDAMPKGGKLTIETGNVALDQSYADMHPEVQPGQYVLLAVSDTGSGMTPEVQRRVFEPFFTTKGVGKGTGLGMAVVHGIVKQSGGSIEVYSEPGIGTAFKLYFPVVDEVFARPTQNSPSEKAGRGTETVLLVEDEGNVRGLAQLMLQYHGYTVVVASNGIEALQTVEKYQGRIDLLVTDVVMPEMDGPDLADALRSRFVQMKVLFISGYTDDAVVRHGILHEEVAFLQKPFSTFALARKVREVLDQPGEAAAPGTLGEPK